VSFDTELAKRYDVLEELGRGGQARVVKARDRLRQTETLVALKIYPVAPDAPRDDLVGEVDVLLNLSHHPNLPVVRNDEFLPPERPDHYVIKMDWIDGPNLQQVLDRDGTPGLPVDRVVHYVTALASALDHLHDSDPPVAHGDVKPANLVLTKDGRVVLVDFGLASGGRGRGSPGFCAPEIAAGGAPSPAADIYGLGATAWTLLTGEPPRGVPPTPAQLDPRLVELLRKCLATSSTARPETAGEVAAELARALDPEPVPVVVGRADDTLSVSEAAFAPSTLLITGGAAAVTVAVGLAIPFVAGVGAVTWGACTAITRFRHRAEAIDPFSLPAEWRAYVASAQTSQRRYREQCERSREGEVKGRLQEIGVSVDSGVRECWSTAKRGDALERALHDLDLDRARQRLAAAEADHQSSPTPTRERTVASLRARVQSGERMQALLDDTRQQLDMLDARLEEAVMMAIELSHRTGSLGAANAVGSAVDEAVQDLQTLGTALDEAADVSARARGITR